MRKFSISGEVRQEFPKIEDESLEEDVKSSSGKVKWEGENLLDFCLTLANMNLTFVFTDFQS